MLSNADLLKGFKSTFLKSEDYEFKKGKFTKELEKKSVKSSHKKSTKSIKKQDSRGKMDDNLKACLDNIYSVNHNSFLGQRETQGKQQKSFQPKFKSDRSILEGVNIQSIQKLIGKKYQSGRVFNANSQSGTNHGANTRQLDQQNYSGIQLQNPPKKDSEKLKNKFQTYNPAKSSTSINRPSLIDNQAIKSFIEKTKQMKLAESTTVNSANRLRDLSGNLKIFKTTNDYVQTK